MHTAPVKTSLNSPGNCYATFAHITSSFEPGRKKIILLLLLDVIIGLVLTFAFESVFSQHCLFALVSCMLLHVLFVQYPSSACFLLICSVDGLYLLCHSLLLVCAILLYLV